jgi:UDP-glucose 4-epimerase
MTWIVTGGAGYIGAHVVDSAVFGGQGCFVIDDLSTGVVERLKPRIPFVQKTLQNVTDLDHFFEDSRITGVVHLAAKKRVGESVERPDYYWQENVVGFQNLLNVMLKHNVKNLVFSSSASVYGQPQLQSGTLVTEETICEPINPYGETKLEGERLSRKFAEEHGFKIAALRYFNVAGAGRKDLGDRFTYNLIPIVFDAIDRGEQPVVFGDDYDTPDGSCIRDYVHVQDLADAHIAAIDLVENSVPGFRAINIGTGFGASVFEVIDMISEVTGHSLEPRVVDRRQGDPASLVADVCKAKEVLSWESKYDLRDIVTSAWVAWQFDKNRSS